MDKLMVVVNPMNKREATLPDEREVVEKVNELVEAVNRIDKVMEKIDRLVSEYIGDNKK